MLARIDCVFDQDDGQIKTTARSGRRPELILSVYSSAFICAIPTCCPDVTKQLQSQHLSGLFDKYVGRALEWLLVNTKPVMYNEQVRVHAQRL
jgi:hypothetical protein